MLFYPRHFFFLFAIRLRKVTFHPPCSYGWCIYHWATTSVRQDSLKAVCLQNYIPDSLSYVSTMKKKLPQQCELRKNIISILFFFFLNLHSIYWAVIDESSLWGLSQWVRLHSSKISLSQIKLLSFKGCTWMLLYVG